MSAPVPGGHGPPPSQASLPQTAQAGPGPKVPTDHPDVSDDDRDLGWGDGPGFDRDRDEWYRSERPPHHG